MVIDTPNLPGKEQAHSTFATEVFQKIMTEALPYLNVFPDTDTAAEDASLADQSEGITNNNEGGLEPGTGETEARSLRHRRMRTGNDPAGDNTAG